MATTLLLIIAGVAVMAILYFAFFMLTLKIMENKYCDKEKIQRQKELAKEQNKNIMDTISEEEKKSLKQTNKFFFFFWWLFPLHCFGAWIAKGIYVWQTKLKGIIKKQFFKFHKDE